uniref:NADH-ubiquinone oxidoreductase chain 2 n=1 Tax=Cicadellidae gen. 1 sp. 2 XYW-2023a TaxID=3078490 RepID=A0AB38ZH99_9HEMI
MLINSSKFMFLSFMIVGVMISVSCNSWIMVWSGMELFLISFVPFFCNYSFVSSECSMKYFLIQGLSSSIFIFSLFFLIFNSFFVFYSFFCFSLLIKLGSAPFHSWIINVVSGMGYDSLFIFFSFSKLPPLFLLSYISYNLTFFVLFCLVIGSVGGLNHSSFKKVMGFSSIFNLGFLIYLVNLGSFWLVYFFMYSFMIFSIFLFLYNYGIEYFNQLYVCGLSFFSKISFWFLFLSMGGMPPMFGFFAKLLVIEFCLVMNDYFISFFMVMLSLIVMFFYIRCCFVSLIIYSSVVKWNCLLNFFYFNLFSFFSVFFFPFGLALSGLI